MPFGVLPDSNILKKLNAIAKSVFQPSTLNHQPEPKAKSRLMLVARRRGLCHAEFGTGGRSFHSLAPRLQTELRSIATFGGMGSDILSLQILSQRLKLEAVFSLSLSFRLRFRLRLRLSFSFRFRLILRFRPYAHL